MKAVRPLCPRHSRYDKTCDDCRIHARLYRRARLYGLRDGTWAGGLWTDARLIAVRAHVRALLARPGVCAPHIADAAGVHISVVYKLNREETRSIHPVYGEALLAVTEGECVRRQLRANPLAKVDGTGTRRRLQALAVDGWDAERLAVLCGIHPTEIRRHRRGDRGLIRAVHRDTIRDLYDKIQSQVDPQGDSDRARKHARVRGYLPPECWADGDIDDPQAEPLPPAPETEDWVAVTNQIEAVLRAPSPGAAADLPRHVKREVARQAWGRLGWTCERIAGVLGYKSAGSVEYLLYGRRDRPHTLPEGGKGAR